MDAWQASLVPGKTVPLEWGYVPITDFIKDPEIKKNVLKAMAAYHKEQQDVWADLNKCPKKDSQNRTCSGRGTCAKGLATRCTCRATSPPTNTKCTMGPAKGRRCSQPSSPSGGTRPIMQLYAAGGKSPEFPIGCNNGEASPGSDDKVTCATDSEGRVQVKFAGGVGNPCPACTGPWSANYTEGMSSKCNNSSATCLWESVFV